MQCKVCGYEMGPFDETCKRCEALRREGKHPSQQGQQSDTEQAAPQMAAPQQPSPQYTQQAQPPPPPYPQPSSPPGPQYGQQPQQPLGQYDQRAQPLQQMQPQQPQQAQPQQMQQVPPQQMQGMPSQQMQGMPPQQAAYSQQAPTQMVAPAPQVVVQVSQNTQAVQGGGDNTATVVTAVGLAWLWLTPWGWMTMLALAGVTFFAVLFGIGLFIALMPLAIAAIIAIVTARSDKPLPEKKKVWLWCAVAGIVGQAIWFVVTHGE